MAPRHPRRKTRRRQRGGANTNAPVSGANSVAKRVNATGMPLAPEMTTPTASSALFPPPGMPTVGSASSALGFTGVSASSASLVPVGMPAGLPTVATTLSLTKDEVTAIMPFINKVKAFMLS